MNYKNKLPQGMIAVMLATGFSNSVLAERVTVNCDAESLNASIENLDPNESNRIKVTGSCVEDVSIAGHRDLTIVGREGASISATNFDPNDINASTAAVFIDKSEVTLRNLTINAGQSGVECNFRSVCILEKVDVLGGHGGIFVQNQSSMDVIGNVQISDSIGAGVGIYGASSLNMRPLWKDGFDPDEPGAVVTGHDFAGISLSDGSFFRGDSVEISGNGNGIWAQRDSLVKVFANFTSGPGVRNNTDYGIMLRSSSTAQIGTAITDNGATGIYVGPLTFLQQTLGLEFSGNGLNIECEHATSVNNTFEPCAP